MKKLIAINGSPRRNWNTARKLKIRPHGICAMKDDLTPIPEKIKSDYIYSDEILTVFPKKLPSAYIYTMNMTEKYFVEDCAAAHQIGYDLIAQ